MTVSTIKNDRMHKIGIEQSEVVILSTS